MPMPTPNKGETRSDFVSRCMSTLAGEFPDQKQRAAVCNSQFEKKKKMSDEQVPKSACTFLADGVVIETDEGSETAKFRMVARSGNPVDHPFWGKIAHDMDGMFIANGKSRVAIDYAHGEEGIGYANHFNLEEGDLKASGSLTPFTAEDKASEVISKSKQGVPYEASINFGGSGIKVQKVDEGQTEMVNGREFEGPGVIVRKWPLRGIAVCLYGADQYTSTEFSEGDTIPVTYTENNEMAKENLFAAVDEIVKKKEEAKEKAKTEKAEVKQEETVEAKTDNDTEEAEAPDKELSAVDTELSERAEQGKAYTEMFGLAKGSEYFTSGLSMVEAMKLFREYTEEEMKRLKLAAEVGGEAEALSADDASKTKKKKEMAITMPEGWG